MPTPCAGRTGDFVKRAAEPLDFNEVTGVPTAIANPGELREGGGGMSDIGVHSNVYQRVRAYGQLVDEVILGLVSTTASRVDPSRRELGELLIGVAAVPPPDLRAAWLGMLIGGAEPSAREEWVRVGRALLSTTIDDDVVDRLRELAGELEERRTEALAKMSGVGT